MVSQGFVGCTLGCLAGGGIEPNAAMLCLFSCYLVESRGGNEGVTDGDETGRDESDDGDGAGDRGSDVEGSVHDGGGADRGRPSGGNDAA